MTPTPEREGEGLPVFDISKLSAEDITRVEADWLDANARRMPFIAPIWSAEDERAAITAFLRKQPTWRCNRSLIRELEAGDYLK